MNRRQETRPTRTFMQSMGNNARAIYMQMIPNGLINKLLFGNSQIDLYQTELLVAVDQNLIMQIQEQITETRASNQATRKELEQIELSQRAFKPYKSTKIRDCRSLWDSHVHRINCREPVAAL